MDSRRPTGRRDVCYTCIQTPKHRAADRRFRRSKKGVALDIRHKHGYSVEDTAALAKAILDPYTRCAICGVPGRWLAGKRREGWRRPLIYRLTIDHLVPSGPSTLSNTRILCFLCNQHRGAAILTDEEVLRKTTAWYYNRGFTSKDLWWLHSSPGTGVLDRLGTERLHHYEMDG